jgi:hypothetical protein
MRGQAVEDNTEAEMQLTHPAASDSNVPDCDVREVLQQFDRRITDTGGPPCSHGTLITGSADSPTIMDPPRFERRELAHVQVPGTCRRSTSGTIDM